MAPMIVEYAMQPKGVIGSKEGDLKSYCPNASISSQSSWVLREREREREREICFSLRERIAMWYIDMNRNHLISMCKNLYVLYIKKGTFQIPYIVLL